MLDPQDAGRYRVTPSGVAPDGSLRAEDGWLDVEGASVTEPVVTIWGGGGAASLAETGFVLPGEPRGTGGQRP